MTVSIMGRRAFGLLLAALGAGLIATGCGEDDGGTTAPGKSDYIASSNAICKETQASVAAPFERIVGEGKPTAAKAQRFLAEGVVPAMRENVARRRSLIPPTGDEAEVEAIIAAGEKALIGFEAAAADRSLAFDLMRGSASDPASEFDSLSEAYGIEDCAGDK